MVGTVGRTDLLGDKHAAARRQPLPCRAPRDPDPARGARRAPDPRCRLLLLGSVWIAAHHDDRRRARHQPAAPDHRRARVRRTPGRFDGIVPHLLPGAPRTEPTGPPPPRRGPGPAATHTRRCCPPRRRWRCACRCPPCQRLRRRPPGRCDLQRAAPAVRLPGSGGPSTLDTPIAFLVDDDQDRTELARRALTVGHDHLLGEVDGGIGAWTAASLLARRGHRHPTVLGGGPDDWHRSTGRAFETGR